jgi:hypothetical protein
MSKKIKSMSLPPTKSQHIMPAYKGGKKKTPPTTDTNQAHSTRKQQTITKFKTQLE